MAAEAPRVMRRQLNNSDNTSPAFLSKRQQSGLFERQAIQWRKAKSATWIEVGLLIWATSNSTAWVMPEVRPVFSGPLLCDHQPGEIYCRMVVQS